MNKADLMGTAQVLIMQLLFQHKQRHYWTAYCPTSQPTEAADTLRTLCLLLLELLAAHNQPVSSQTACDHPASGTLFWVCSTGNKQQQRRHTHIHFSHIVMLYSTSILLAG